ncbi:MAG: twin-arginine translocation signal domain-containing protein [Thaumarchaeota archaeon]|nr:twin-arginine translocation signal domain-containing protein [Nitrososphaerota archaeon]
MSNINVNRRDFIKYIGGAAVGLGIGGAGYLSANSQVGTVTSELEQVKEELKGRGHLGYVFGAEGSIATIDLSRGKVLASSGPTWIAEAGSIDWCNHYPDANGNVWGLVRKSGQIGSTIGVNPATNELVHDVPLDGRWRIRLGETDTEGRYGYMLNGYIADKYDSEKFNASRDEFEIPYKDIDPGVIHKVDLLSGKVVDKLEVPKFCCDVAIAPDGRLWLANQLESLLTVVDTNSFTIEEHLATEYFDYGASMVTISPNNDVAFIEVNSAGNWSNAAGFKNLDPIEMVWDIQAKEMVKEFPLESGPRTSEFTPDGKYCIVRTRPASIVYDVDSLTEVTKIEIENTGHPAFSPDSSLAYIPNPGDSSVDVFEVGSFKKVDSLKLPYSPSKIIPINTNN